MITGNHLSSTKLNLPLFIASRNKIKKYHFSEVLTYVTKNSKNYIPYIEGTLYEVEEYENDKKVDKNENQRKETSYSYSKVYKKPEKLWQLAPNRYNIPGEFGSFKKGIKWSLSKTIPKLKKDAKLKNQTIFYEISTNILEQLQNKCNCHKGQFLTDPRNRKPTTRFMINNPVTCWRNQNDPGPTSYFVRMIEKLRFKKVFKKPIVPYKFLRYSCVPENERLRLIEMSSFKSGPGRYELLDDENSLQFNLAIQTQKRLQFRRLHFKRIGLPKQNPSFTRRHIFGYGYTRLFRGTSIMSSKKLISKKKTHRINHELRMFSSFEYIKMITNPDRNLLSIRIEELPETSSILRFNCLVKVHKRRQLRDNKKVVFGSGVPRFKDADFPNTRKQSKMSPLVNFPIMTINPNEIKTKLNAIPERLRAYYQSNRMQPFKFQPIPPVKLLLNEKEVRPDGEKIMEMYPKELNPMKFFKNISSS